MFKLIWLILFTINNLFSQNSVVQQFSDSFADVAEKAKPAVVTIITDKIMKAPNNDLYFFFNPYMDPNGEREYKTNALGSGVIVDANKGYIITNKVGDIPDFFDEDINITYCEYSIKGFSQALENTLIDDNYNLIKKGSFNIFEKHFNPFVYTKKTELFLNKI